MLKTAPDLVIENLSSPVIGQLHHAHCSGIVAFPDGELFAVFYHALKEANPSQAIYGVRKLPNSSSWSKPFIVSKDISRRMEGNPVIWIAPDTQYLWLFYITSWGGWSTCILRAKYSTDKGHTWSKSQKIYPHMSRLSKNPPILTKSGMYILPVTIEFRDVIPVFFTSSNQGKSWYDYGARILVPPEYRFPNAKWGRLLDQPTIIERKDGSLFALMRAYRPLGKMFETTSSDGGKTWTAPKPSALPNPDGGFHMMRLKSGRIAIIYNHSSTERNPLSIALSEDDGVSWKYRSTLCESLTDNSEQKLDLTKQNKYTFEYPTLTQGSDETIHITWSFRYTNEAGTFMDIQYTNVNEKWIIDHSF